MKKLLVACMVLILSGCETVPDSVKIALEKEGAAIRAVELDYRTSVNKYHEELLSQIDARLNDTFRYEIEKKETSKGSLTTAEVMELENQRATQRAKLVSQAEETKKRYLSSKNLEILKALHEKVLLYVASDKFTASDFATVLIELDAAINEIKQKKEMKDGENTSTSIEGA